MDTIKYVLYGPFDGERAFRVKHVFFRCREKCGYMSKFAIFKPRGIIQDQQEDVHLQIPVHV